MKNTKSIVYSFHDPRPETAELRLLFQQTGWAAQRSLSQVETLLSNSDLVLTARDGGRLIGFYRAITDFTCRAFLEDMVVDEDYRGLGICSELCDRMLDRLKHVDIIYHFSDVPFVLEMYRRRGFHDVTHLIAQEKRLEGV